MINFVIDHIPARARVLANFNIIRQAEILESEQRIHPNRFLLGFSLPLPLHWVLLTLINIGGCIV